MSLRITTQPLRRRIAASACRLCASVDSTTTAAAAAARQQWQTTRPFSFHNKPSIHHQRVGNARPFFHRFASTAATASRSSTGDGPTVNIPEFPTHANRPPVGGGLEKQEIQGTAPSFDALKADEDWGEDTELVSPEEAKIYITGPALTQLVKIASREPDWNPARPHLALRLAVESGGCHGYQYEMKLEELVGTSSSEGGKAVNVDD
ncbi:hypothetical protein QFC21_001879 [Naganishia friedmannii]|uniref:Uncharacterized protein n=1 Tax=Naganishia friedmannii TaxID=89922 RepID=A0ACC2W242_9TREE|nr:hypothetical protein QFC21_001879 [Naganishia friedmannii]